MVKENETKFILGVSYKRPFNNRDLNSNTYKNSSFHHLSINLFFLSIQGPANIITVCIVENLKNFVYQMLCEAEMLLK